MSVVPKYVNLTYLAFLQHYTCDMHFKQKLFKALQHRYAITLRSTSNAAMSHLRRVSSYGFLNRKT
jgi:hypothetical protein